MRTLHIVLLAAVAFVLGLATMGTLAFAGMHGMMGPMDMSAMFDHCEQMMRQHHPESR